jgi:hypothetical protein
VSFELPPPGKMAVGRVEDLYVFVGPSEMYSTEANPRFYVNTYSRHDVSSSEFGSVRVLPVSVFEVRRQIDIDIRPHAFDDVSWTLADAELELYALGGEVPIETKPWNETGWMTRQAGVKRYDKLDEKGKFVKARFVNYGDGYDGPVRRVKGDGIELRYFCLHYGLTLSEYNALKREGLAPKIVRGVIRGDDFAAFPNKVATFDREVDSVIARERRSLARKSRRVFEEWMSRQSKVVSTLSAIERVLRGEEQPELLRKWIETGQAIDGVVIIIDDRFRKLAQGHGWFVSERRVPALGLRAWSSETGNRLFITNDETTARTTPKVLADRGMVPLVDFPRGA